MRTRCMVPTALYGAATGYMRRWDALVNDYRGGSGNRAIYKNEAGADDAEGFEGGG